MVRLSNDTLQRLSAGEYIYRGESPKETYIRPQFFGAFQRRVPVTGAVPAYVPMGQTRQRLWDTGTNWRHLEPTTKGQFVWTQLDSWLTLARTNGFKVLLTLGQAPNWATGGTSNSGAGNDYNTLPPTNPSDFYDMVVAVLSRCESLFPGVVDSVQVWNEVDFSLFWTGTVDQMVELHRQCNLAVRSVNNSNSSNIKVVAASVTAGGGGYLKSMLRRSMGDYVDAFSCHLYVYPNQPESIVGLGRSRRYAIDNAGYPNKELWNTEWTWNTYYDNSVLVPDSGNNSMPEGLATSYMSRGILCCSVAGITRQYFYGIDKNDFNKIITNVAQSTTLLGPGKAYQFISGLIADKNVKNLTNVGNLWTVEIDDGRIRAWWASDNQNVSVSMNGITSIKNSLGEDLGVVPSSYNVGMSPIFGWVG